MTAVDSDDRNDARLRFRQALYAEHLEEAAFLYDQRGVLLNDEGAAWTDLAPLEARLEAHLDGLVVGAETALKLCAQSAGHGEPGERHVAMRVFCRQGRLDLIEAALDHLDLGDMDGVLAVRNAFKHEWPTAWETKLPSLFEQKPEASLAVLSKAIGFRRLPFDDLLVELLPVCPREFRYPLVWSLGRLKTSAGRQMLRSFVEGTDTSLRAPAGLALLRMGERLDAIPFQALSGDHPLEMVHLLQAMFSGAGDPSAALIQRLDAGAQAADCAIALGVMGDPAAIGPLIEMVDDSQHGDAAALALNLITGAALFEEVILPEKVDRDELFDEELLQTDEAFVDSGPDHGAGEKMTRLSHDPEVWGRWWHAHRTQYQTGMRFRNGRPCSPLALLENLQRETSPRLVRRLAAEELVIRYAIDVPFETDMTVEAQRAALEQLTVCCTSQSQRFEDGRWYFGGNLLG